MRAPLALLCVAVALVAGCRRPPETRSYVLEGQILAVKPESHQLLVKHDDIPGFMPAMTMAYIVKDPALLENREPGDLITATLVVAADSAWLTVVTKIGTAPLPEDAPTKVPAAAGVQILKPGDSVPNTGLMDQDGVPLSLTNWLGSAVAVTFIYTRCPLPEYCPLVDRRFAELQRIVAADATLRGHARLLSVSFDPQNDQPPVLAAHARTLGADPKFWRFATASESDVESFAAAFGVNVIREKDGSITHNLRTAVIDPSGHVEAIYDDTRWTAARLAADLRRSLAHDR